jgi:hypothetical protein
MPWKESNTMDLRVRLIQDYEQGCSIASLAEIYEVSRKTIYKWLDRHQQAGAAGLADLSRRPQHSPSRVSDEVIAQIVAARDRWHWGLRTPRIEVGLKEVSGAGQPRREHCARPSTARFAWRLKRFRGAASQGSCSTDASEPAPLLSRLMGLRTPRIEVRPKGPPK